ncbi:MAG: 6-carboxyhexanoate--CoA ligase [Thermodesulfovibrionales bacterium]
MRASKSVGGQHSTVNRQRSIHISGAEGLYEFSEIDKITKDYFLRAMSHPRGKPDKVVITIERVEQKPTVIPLLTVSTVRCGSQDEARKVIESLLSEAGVSRKAMKMGISIVMGRKTMRGASMIRAESGLRVEPDKERGVRASRLGIEKSLEKSLSRRLARAGINTTTVKEALILASKVASCNDVVAELCISDDPDYITGYAASKRFGYVRIPNIKQKGSMIGGRVFFINEDADVEQTINYLEETPVIVGK